MICACGLPSVRVLRTTTRTDGVIARRRACSKNHRWTTYELHEDVVVRDGDDRLAEDAGRVLQGVLTPRQIEVLVKLAGLAELGQIDAAAAAFDVERLTIQRHIRESRDRLGLAC